MQSAGNNITSGLNNFYFSYNLSFIPLTVLFFFTTIVSKGYTKTPFKEVIESWEKTDPTFG